MCLSVVRRFDCQCHFLICLWSLAVEVRINVGLHGRWQEDQSHGTHYVASLTSCNNLKKHVWVQWDSRRLKWISHILKPRTHEQSDEASCFSSFFCVVCHFRGSCRICSIRCCQCQQQLFGRRSWWISSFRCAASLEWSFWVVDWLFDIGLRVMLGTSACSVTSVCVWDGDLKRERTWLALHNLLRFDWVYRDEVKRPMD